MKAKVTIYDDNGNPKGAYELMPTREFDCGLSIKYVFEFEYNQLKDRTINALRGNDNE